MSTRARQHDATVVGRVPLGAHLVRLELEVPGFETTGVPDEWVALVVPGQFQSRYYTVRSVEPTAAAPRLLVDVVLHEEGLVTGWAARDVVGEQVVLSEARGSFDPPPDATWLMLVGDLTALPAMARIAGSTTLPTRVWAEVPEVLPDYLPAGVDVTWSTPPGAHTSALADLVAGLDWPDGPGYFWMAGESGQMRAIRRHLTRDRALPGTAFDVMGYWRGGAVRQPRAVDPGPVYRAGRAAGLSDEQIWAAYDEAREA